MARGTTQNGVRLYNERLALSLIRRHGSLPKAEIARLTGLSAQTVSVIVRQLETDQLLVKETPQRGKVGQPLVPFSLNPDGAFSIGLKVGRRSGDLILLDLTGKVRRKVHQPYVFPTPQKIMDFVAVELEGLLSGLSPEQKSRISGLGIATPFELWNWEEEVGASHEVLEAWRDFDIAARLPSWVTGRCISAMTQRRPVRPNCCLAGATASTAMPISSWAILSAAALSSTAIFFRGRRAMPVPLVHYQFQRPMAGPSSLPTTPVSTCLRTNCKRRALIPCCSHVRLTTGGKSAPHSISGLSRPPRALPLPPLRRCPIIDFEAIIIDGAMPADVRAELVEKTRDALTRQDLRGLPKFSIEEGSIGADARAMGAASLSLFANYIIDRDVLFKEAF